MACLSERVKNMKKTKNFLAAFGLLAASALPAAAAAPPTTGYYSITYDTSRGTATLQLAGIMTVAPTSSTLKTGALITLNGTSGLISTTYGISAATVAATTFTGALAGNATTASALAANGANCSAGNYPLGVNASGAAEGCTVAATGNGHDITTGTLTAGATPYPTREVLTFDSLYFIGTDTAAANATFISLNAASSTAVSSSTFITVTGAGTYTTPTGANQLIIDMCGGGGGGAGSGTGSGDGGVGTATTFDVFTASYGAGGGGAVTYLSGTGGTGGAGAGFALAGGNGMGGSATAVVFTQTGGVSFYGGAGVFAGGAAQAGSAAKANSCSGGSGGVNNATASGGSGGAGEFRRIVINSPGASYSYSVGSGGAAGTGTDAGGAGGSGRITVTAHFPTIGPTGATGATGAAGADGNYTQPNPLTSSSITVTGNAFSVGLATFVVTGGNVGIGIAAPTSKLHLEGVASGQRIGTFTANTAASNSYGLYVDAGTNSNDVAFSVRNVTGVTPYLQVLGGGSVCVGCATSGAILQVSKSGGVLQIGGSATSNGSNYLKMLGSNSVTNWQMTTNFNTAGALEFVPSTAGGGETFTTTAMRFNSDSSAWFVGDVSVLSLTDRTPYPETKEDAYLSVKSMRRKISGGVDHQAMHSSIRRDHVVKRQDPVTHILSEHIEHGRDLSATVSAQNEVIKDLIKRIEVLEAKP